MTYSAKILADSESQWGTRLTTLEVSFPRFVLSEFNTHCMLSRNSASSRAVPVAKKLQEVATTPFVPERFGKNQRGMQAESWLSGADHDEAVSIWLEARDAALLSTLRLLGSSQFPTSLPDNLDERMVLIQSVAENRGGRPSLDIHKQTANRLLEPFMWHTVIVTATDWSNFFALRTSSGAQPEIRKAAVMMKEAMEGSTPTPRSAGEWHLPLVQPDESLHVDLAPEKWVRVSAARCARVSYLTHLGVRDVDADIALAERLLADGHMSPFEHVASCMTPDEYEVSQRAGKLRGWYPYRARIPDEADFAQVLRKRGEIA